MHLTQNGKKLSLLSRCQGSCTGSGHQCPHCQCPAGGCGGHFEIERRETHSQWGPWMPACRVSNDSTSTCDQSWTTLAGLDLHVEVEKFGVMRFMSLHWTGQTVFAKESGWARAPKSPEKKKFQTIQKKKKKKQNTVVIQKKREHTNTQTNKQTNKQTTANNSKQQQTTANPAHMSTPFKRRWLLLSHCRTQAISRKKNYKQSRTDSSVHSTLNKHSRSRPGSK